MGNDRLKDKARQVQISYWVESANHDFDVAVTLFQNKKYDWCLFIGHLVIEKVLKAIFIDKNSSKIPPKIHNLVRLSELSNIEISESKKLLLDKVNDFHIATRYPDFKFKFYKTCTKNFTKIYFNNIKDLYKWLKSLIK